MGSEQKSNPTKNTTSSGSPNLGFNTCFKTKSKTSHRNHHQPQCQTPTSKNMSQQLIKSNKCLQTNEHEKVTDLLNTFHLTKPHKKPYPVKNLIPTRNKCFGSHMQKLNMLKLKKQTKKEKKLTSLSMPLLGFRNSTGSSAPRNESGQGFRILYFINMKIVQVNTEKQIKH